MSATVDSRVVEMQFNNKQFEQNANQSIKTLDKLNSSLDLKGSTEGFDALQKSIKAVDLGNINSAMDAVTNKISMIGVIGDQVLRNLTNKVVDFGTRWVKSLSIDQISSGFEKYASKTESVQTIMNATGKSIDEVSKVLDKLNKYTDETSYSYSEMVASIGKFTSAGVDLEVAENAMEGIANWAAKAGVSTSKANTAFYNLSQAISTGALTSLDWKSLDNISMTTMDVKEQFIEAGLAVGTLKKQWDGTVVTAKGWHKVTAEAMKDTLQYKWLTNDVLLKTLEKYADTTQEFGLKAFKAAQEAKTFKDAIDAVKDAVSTGWMKVFEQIFGNYEEARVLWTDVANELIEAFTAPTTALFELLKGWHDNGGYIAFVESLSNTWQGLKSIVGDVSEIFQNMFPGISVDRLVSFTEKVRDLTEAFRDSVTKKTIEDFIPDPERLKMLEKQGTDLSEFYDEIDAHNKEVDSNLSPLRDTVTGIFSVLNLVKTTLKGIFKLTVPFIKLIGPIARVISAIASGLGRLTTKMVDAILNSKALNTVFGYLQRTVNGISRIIGIVIDDFADFINNLKDLPAVKRFSKLLGDIWQNIENLASPYIKKAKAAIEGFLDSLESVEKEDIYNFINGIAEKLMDFAGVAIEVASAISDYLAPKLELLGQYAGKAFDFLRKKFEGISNWVKEFIATEEFQTLKNEVTKIVGGIAQKVKSLGLELAAFIREGGLLGVFKWLTKNLTDLWDVISHMKWSKVLQDALTGIEAGGFLAAALSIYRASRLFKTANDFISGLPKTLKSMTKGLGIKRIATSILMLAGAIYLLAQVPVENIWTLVGAVAALGLTLTVLTLGMSLAQGFFSKMGLIDNKAMLTAAASMIIMAGAMLMLAKATAILGDIPAKNLERAMSSLLGIMIIMTVATIAIGAAGTGIKALGIGLLAIAAAILILIVAFDKIKGYLESLKLATEKNAIVNALYIMAGLVVALITLSIVMKKVSKAAWETAAVILATGLAVYLVAAAAKKLLDLDTSKLWHLVEVLGILIGALAALAAVARFFPKEGGKALLGMAGAMAGLGASVLMMVYAMSLLGKMDASILKKGIKNLGEIMALIATVMLSSAFTRIKGGAFVGLAFAIVAIVGILKYLSNQSYGSFSASARMLGNVLLALGSSLAIGGSTLKKANLPNMISTIVLVVAVAGALWWLANYTNYADLKGAANILCATFVGLAAAMRIGASGLKAATWAGMVTSVLMVIFVAAALYFLASMPLGGLIAAAAAMGIVLETLADSMTRMNVGTMGLSWSRIGPSLVLMIGMMASVYGALQGLAGYPWRSLLASAAALSMVIGALSGSVTLLSSFKVNFDKRQIVKTLVMMAGIITIAGVALWAMAKAFEKVDTSTLMEIASSVGVLMLSLAAVTAAIGAIGTFIKPAAVLDGLLGMAEVIAGIALLFTAVWAIDTIITAANGDLIKGIERIGEVLTAIASVLGEVIGAFVVGIGVGFSEGLPTIATNFSTFVDTIVPAAEKFGGLSFNSEGIEAIKNFATAILVMTAADVLDALTRWVPGRTDPIQKFAEDMTALGPSLKRFAFSMTGVNLKALSIGSQAISLLGDVAAKMPYVDGLIQEITGKPKSLGEFANELYTMIEGENGEEGGLIKFANACPDLVGKIDAMNQVADVISSLGDIANAMNPKTVLTVGDWLTYVETAGDLKAFAEQLPAVAESITTFASKIDIPSDFPTKTQEVIDALQPLSELALALSDDTDSYGWGAYKTTTDPSSGFLKFAMGLATIADTLRNIGQRISPEDLRKFESVGRVFKGFADASSAILPGLNDTAFVDFCLELQGGASALVSAGEQWAQVKFDDIETGLSRLGELVSIKQTEFEGWGTDVAGSLVDGFESSLEESTPGMVSKTVAKLSSSIEATIDMFSVGQDAVQGFIDGALSKVSEVVRAGIVIGGSFSGGVRSSLDVNSPSRVLMKIGSYVGEGFVLGVQKWNAKSEQAGYNLTEPLVNSASLALDYVRELMSGETDVDMTIRPVMDLTDVNNGMATISSLFSQRQAVMAQIDAEATTDKADIDELVEVGWKILKEIQNGSDLYLDDKVLAGRINRRLGQV